MKDMADRFAGSVPANYDRLMVPLLFRPYAEELARRVRALQPRRILETAAGTGAVTQALNDALPDATIVATDLNQPMLDMAAQRVRSPNVEFQAADAQQLPFEDGIFDAVVCQFGAMFFPEKVRAHSEARRVLREGGTYMMAIWDRIDRNAASDAAQQALVEMFPNDPPLFMREGPFGYYDLARIESDLREAGFNAVVIDTVELRSRSASSTEAATALCYGTPMGSEIADRGDDVLETAFERVKSALRQFDGPDGFDAPMSAHIVTATR
jgi:ubiquinone/menaquinone biosynthesis C-methylase UbiE